MAENPFDIPSSESEQPVQKAPPPPLSERDFVQENIRKNPTPFWVWICILTILIGIFWGASSWFNSFYSNQFTGKPFLQVTNREFSLFLWQNPEFMRVNSKTKQGYLPGFQYQEKIGMDLAAADELVSAPPATLFLYHTWNRLLSKEFTETDIPLEQYKEFIQQFPEWEPTNWKEAPQEYVHFMQDLPKEKTENLRTLSKSVLPVQVRMAFQGWKNYYKDAETVNKLSIDVKKMAEFLKSHPNYARPYWQNIVKSSRPDYLISFNPGHETVTGALPDDQLTAFLKLAFYNFTISQKGSAK